MSINEDPKLEKGKEKKGSAARGLMRSSSHVSLRDCVYHNVYYNPPFSTSAVTEDLALNAKALINRTVGLLTQRCQLAPSVTSRRNTVLVNFVGLVIDDLY